MSKYRKQTLNWAEAIISFWRWDEVICRSSGWFWLWLLLWFWLQILLWLQFWRLLYYWTWASSGRQRRRFSLYSWNFYFNHLHVTSITANSWGVFSTRSISTFLIWPSWQWESSMQPSIMSTKFRKLAEFLGKIYLDTISPPPFQSLHGKHWHLTVLTPHCPSLHHPLQDLQSQHKKDSDTSTLQNITLSFIRFTNFQPPWAWTSWSCLTCTWIGSLLHPKFWTIKTIWHRFLDLFVLSQLWRLWVCFCLIQLVVGLHGSYWYDKETQVWRGQLPPSTNLEPSWKNL